MVMLGYACRDAQPGAAARCGGKVVGCELGEPFLLCVGETPHVEARCEDQLCKENAPESIQGGVGGKAPLGWI